MNRKEPGEHEGCGLWRAIVPVIILFLFLAVPANAENSYSGETGYGHGGEELVSVASQEGEPLRETPVITSVITGEEIRRMGARTLNEVLLTVPGFSDIQDHNEIYSSLRSIYGSAQQKILVLRDGHRLNMRFYSEANFGPAIGLDNVERVEIMRGPGSALYGDVATAGVINIITRDAKKVDGQELTAGAGSYGQLKTGYVYGRDLGRDRDLLFFGSVYKSDGEKKRVAADRDGGVPPAAGVTVLDRIGGGSVTPPHDVGLKYRSGNFQFSASHRTEHYTMPRAGGGGTGQLIDLDAYRKFEGIEPGMQSAFWHSELKYGAEVFGDGELVLRPYYDEASFLDNEPQYRAGETGSGLDKGYTMKHREIAYGFQGSVSKPYRTAGWGGGSILGGIQAEQMDLQYSWDVQRDTAAAVYSMGTPGMLPAGKEHSYAAYTQLRHKFTKQYLLNAGVRYDYKSRAQGYDPVDNVSPLAALIYMPDDKLSFRASYGRSFSDAPYWYRFNRGGGSGYLGSGALKPEVLDSCQVSAELYAGNGISHRLNFFHNEYNNVIYRSGAVYLNTGAFKLNGAEYEAGIKRPNLAVRAQYTFQYALDRSSGYLIKSNMIANIPQHTGSVVLDYAPWRGGDARLAKNLWLNYTLRFVGREYAPVTTPAGSGSRDLTHTSPAYWLSNAGLSFEDFLWKQLTFRFHVYNLFNRQYTQGGSVSIPYEQPGRWYLAQFTLKL